MILKKLIYFFELFIYKKNMDVSIHLPMLSNDDFNLLLKTGTLKECFDESNSVIYYLLN